MRKSGEYPECGRSRQSNRETRKAAKNEPNFFYNAQLISRHSSLRERQGGALLVAGFGCGFEFETDMRWYVEVSRVGENNLAEKYCVDAKQWQAALQEARKLRGDTGALSQFSIELLDNGYRAVDPALKLRYLVNQAPDDAALSEQSNHAAISVAEGTGHNHRVADVVRASLPPTSLAPAAAGSSLVPRPGSHSPPRPTSINPPRASNAAPRLQQMVVPDDPVPPAPPAPGSLAVVAALPSVPPASLPNYEVVRERTEEPRPDSPITYRELAFAVAPGATRSQVEALLQDRYRATRATIEDRPAGKFVQLAVFDHVFKRRPERPPLGTFAWKDWRGDPVLAFPGFGEAPLGPMSQVPPAPPSLLPPSNGAALNSSAPSVSAGASLSLLPMPTALAPSVPPAPAPALGGPPMGSLAPSPMVTLNAAPAAASEPALVAPPVAAELAVAAPVVTAPVVAEPFVAPLAPVLAEPVVPAVAAPVPASGFDLNFESTPFNAAPAAPKSSPDKERVSRPRLAVGRRRASGEDLISELFDFMHELHFQRDFAAGAEFVLSVLNEMLPCEGVLIHVFDINTGHFVVVRAKGPNASSVLLQRMPDQDPFVRAVMRSPQSVSVPNAANDPRFQGARWQAVGVAPRAALAGGVQQGGRYLGLIELVNPEGSAPFHAAEVNALDYICAQFAEFLSKKPLVLAADVVLARV